jgi:23S rRNA U2552 (ribose-2'-O)-methylase RlmE/FtsJ
MQSAGTGAGRQPASHGAASAPASPPSLRKNAALQKQGYVSRAAYKLIEIQKKHQVIRAGGKVLDLGCVPGAWLQVASQHIGPKDKGGLVLGIDIQVRA